MHQRILVTRPQAQSGPLIEALKAQGDEPLALPLLQITVFNETQHARQCLAIKHCIQHLDAYHHIICISTNAAEAAWYWINLLRPQLSLDQNWYGIGEATTKTLQKHLANVEQSGKAMNSESLLQHPMLQAIENQRVLICRGEGGREFLKSELEKRGARVDYCEIYRREPILYTHGELQQLLNQGIDFLTVTSTETIHQLLEQAMIEGIKREVLQLPIIAPGERVCSFANTAGFKHVIEAENAGLKAMLEALNNK